MSLFGHNSDTLLHTIMTALVIPRHNKQGLLWFFSLITLHIISMLTDELLVYKMSNNY